MEQLIAHGWGDFVLQWSWMAKNKTKNTLEGWLACLVHCIVYTLPFLLLFPEASWTALWYIFYTHFIIDKFDIGKKTVVMRNAMFDKCNEQQPFPEWVPQNIATWLIIIVDNIFHITINYFCLKYL